MLNASVVSQCRQSEVSILTMMAWRLCRLAQRSRTQVVTARKILLPQWSVARFCSRETRLTYLRHTSLLANANTAPLVPAMTARRVHSPGRAEKSPSRSKKQAQHRRQKARRHRASSRRRRSATSVRRRLRRGPTRMSSAPRRSPTVRALCVQSRRVSRLPKAVLLVLAALVTRLFSTGTRRSRHR